MDLRSFELAAGSVIGRDHRVIPRNSQDASAFVSTPDFAVAVVTDGCGSSARSEVGAVLGARLAISSIQWQLERQGAVDWRLVERHILAGLHQLAGNLGGSYEANVQEYFLFTLVACVMTAQTARFVAVGDGLVVVNDEVIELGPFPGNQPPYLGYGLLSGEGPRFELVREVSMAQLQSFLIGTDGACDLLRLAGHPLPGSSVPVGPIAQFWTDEAVFRNPAVLSRRLKLIGRDVTRRTPTGGVTTDHGLLPDDTTMIVGRLAKGSDPT